MIKPGHAKLQFISLRAFKELDEVDEEELSKYFSCENRPEYVGLTWSSKNGIQTKVADNPDSVLSTYASTARNCNCGVIAINTDGLHANAVFHLDPTEYDKLQTPEGITQFKSDINSRFRILFQSLDKFIQGENVTPGQDIFVDFLISGGCRPWKKGHMRDDEISQSSNEMREIIEDAFEQNLKITMDRTKKLVKIHAAKSTAFGQTGHEETNIHYNPQKNIISVATNAIGDDYFVDPEIAYADYSIHKLHAAQ